MLCLNGQLIWEMQVSRYSIEFGFIEKEDAISLINYIKTNKTDPSLFYQPEKPGKERHQSYSPEYFDIKIHKEVLHLIQKYSEKIVSYAKHNFTNGSNAYVASFWLSCLGPNTKLPPHTDNNDWVVDGKPVHQDHLNISGVLYLNEDFEGGELRFTDSGHTYAPKGNSMVMFEPTDEHEIMEIKSGYRYSCPFWLTFDKDKSIL
jgi:hypothetical protein